MGLDLGDMTYSEYDIKRKIKIPTKLNRLLAEDLGFHIGDGCMSVYIRNDNGRKRYYFNYSGNSKKDADYFKRLQERKLELYNLKIAIKKSKRSNAIYTTFHSRAIFNFFRALGIPSGKKRNIGVPLLVKNSNSEIKSAFIRGLAAADFSVCVKNRSNGIYPSINFETISKTLRNGVCDILNECRITFTKYCKFRIDKRFKAPTKTYSLDINGRKRLKLWMDKIGFSDKRNLNAVSKFGLGRIRTSDPYHVKVVS